MDVFQVQRLAACAWQTTGYGFYGALANVIAVAVVSAVLVVSKVILMYAKRSHV